MAEALNAKLDWLCCPKCGGKTRTQIRPHTVLEDFPLFCPKCRYACVIWFRNGKMIDIKRTDASARCDPAESACAAAGRRNGPLAFAEIQGGRDMNMLIGCCGLDCEVCDARIATITNDNALREKTAVLWTRLNGTPVLPEMINCTGCRMEGAKTPFCDKLCPVHSCVREKRLDTCADCENMDGCQTLGCIAANSPFVLENLRKLRGEKRGK